MSDYKDGRLTSPVVLARHGTPYIYPSEDGRSATVEGGWISLKVALPRVYERAWCFGETPTGWGWHYVKFETERVGRVVAEVFTGRHPLDPIDTAA